MKRKIITLLLAITVASVFNATVMAADENKVNGFYDFGENENVEITVYSGDTEVSATEKDVDGDGELDQWYAESERLEVTLKDAIDNSYYGAMLVDGRGLPTKDSKVYFLDQDTAKDMAVSFNVNPRLPDTATEMSLYVSSNVRGFKLINIPVSYAVSIDNYTPGDVNNDGTIDTSDIISTRRFITGGWGVTINEKAADVDADEKHSARDVILMRRFVAGGYNVELK